MSSNQARQFTTNAKKLRLVAHIDRGDYVAINPSIAIRAWALPSYYAQLLLLHDALDHLGIDHVFACLTASSGTDLIFDRPWLVTRASRDSVAPNLDRFVYEYRWEGKERIEALGESYSIPTLSRPETALLLGATGLSRELQAAHDLIEEHPPSEALVPAFNFFGIRLGSDTLESKEPDLEFPEFIQDRRRRLGEELLRGGGS